MGARGRGAKPVRGPKAGGNRLLAAIDRIPDRADRAIAWIERLRLTRGADAGRRLRLRPWQREIVRGILRTGPDGRRIVRRCLVSCGRKNGKTQLIASVALLFLAGPEAVPRGQVVSAGADRAQASLIHAEIAAFVAADKVLGLAARVLLRSFHKDARDVVTGSEYRALAAVAERVMGLGPAVWIADELAQWGPNARDLLTALQTSQGSVDQPLAVVISTTSPDPHSVMREWWDEAQAVLAGKHVDPSFLPFVWSAGPDLAWDSDEAMEAANPALGDFLSLAEMRDARDQARRVPARQSSFEQLRLNRPVAADCRFISSVDWLACCKPFDADELRGTRAIGSLDLSSTSDLTSFVLFHPGSGHLQVWGFLPALQVDEKERSDQVPYRQWAEDGHVVFTPGRAIDRRFVAGCIKTIIAPFDVDVIVADRWMLENFRQDAESVGLMPVLEGLGQGFATMGPATSAFETLVLNAGLIVDSPLLTWAVSNAHVLTDPAGNRKISKEYASSGRRVDPLIATIMAVYKASTAPEPIRITFGAFIV
jgi:phage terminase large subunit-like protein